MSIAVVFPGQGSQKVGMGADLATDIFNKADVVLKYALSDIIFNGPEDDLRLTQNTQPALLTHSFALWNEVKDKVKPSYFAGHSLGEYTALVAAGGLTFEDALLAVHNRGKFMQNAVPVGVGGMVVVLGANDDDVEAVCAEVTTLDSIVEPANYNCPGQIVVAGHSAALERFSAVMKERGARRVLPLPVSAPFHCSLMKPAQDEMKRYLQSINMETLHTPVINNVDAKLEISSNDIRDSLVRQMSGAVRWTQSINELVTKGVTTIIEVGSGAVLTGLIKKIDKSINCINISTVDDVAKLNDL